MNEQCNTDYKPTEYGMPLGDLTPDYAADSAPTYNPEQNIENQNDYINEDSSSSKSGSAFSSVGKVFKYFFKWYRIVGLIVTIFFFFYMICLFGIYHQEYLSAKDDETKSIVDVPASVPALHWCLWIVALVLGITLILANGPIHWGFSVAACVVFAAFWIANSVVASQTGIYKAAQNNMKPNAYYELNEKIRNNNPQVTLQVSGSYTKLEYVKDSNGKYHLERNTYYCHSNKVTFNSESSVDNSDFPNISNVNEELIYVQLDQVVEWTDTAKRNIDKLKAQFLQAMKDKWYSQVERWDPVSDVSSVPDYVATSVISENELEGFLSTASRVALSIFWAPAAFIYKLASATYFMRGAVHKLEAEMNTQSYDFSDCYMTC
ncbi:hypothetical protein GPJ56_004208 [Histomonas meleagridis]|uniref:uncharacterized protein n=1 Tax=Histomonas meleagridis TaxID=135588 RepID=UPI003559DA68|nr:hypothetical protein GPJ56_004208 [Histomonas meleagridis]KAH0802243.1 hypothetical protein GO595_004856 [Histomonas meleagridis]